MTCTATEGPYRGVYIASKAKYGPEWRTLRANGYPFMSTWIDESGTGQTSDWPDLWTRCIEEASRASALVLICRPGDTLKGAWAEVGAALANGRRVFAVGVEGFSIRHHPLVILCESEDAAFAEARVLACVEPLTVAEAAGVLLPILLRKHEESMKAKGRNPADYVSPYRTAGEVVAALGGEDRG